MGFLVGCEAPSEADTWDEPQPDYCEALRDRSANCDAETEGCAPYTCGFSLAGPLGPGALCPTAMVGYAPVTAFYQVVDEVCVTSNFDYVLTCDNYEEDGPERLWIVSCFWQEPE